MKIILINPPWKNSNSVLPLGLAYLGAVLENEGFEVKAIDANAIYAKYTIRDIYNMVREYNPDIIAISVYSDFAKNTYSLINLLSNLKKLMVIGGPHPTARPYEAFEHSKTDVVVYGEGEETILELVNRYNNGKSFKGVKGVIFRDKNGKVVTNGPRKPISELDSLPSPAKHLFNPALYGERGGGGSFGAISSSRGCPGRCTFCFKAVHGNNFRFRSAKNIFDEIVQCKKMYGVRDFSFVDDAFTVKKDRVEELCNMIIRNNLGISWYCASRINMVDEKLLLKMKQAGCSSIEYGLEHGDNESLRKMNKYTTVEQIENTYKLNKKVGIKFLANFIFGFPWDTVKTVRDTLKMARKLGQDGINTSYLIPYPETFIYNEYNEKHNLTDWWLKRGGMDEHELKEIAFGKKFSSPFIKLQKDVEKEVEYALREIYSRLSTREFGLSDVSFGLRKVAWRISPYLEVAISHAITKTKPIWGVFRRKK